MRKLRIAVDIDDVLAENAAGFVKYSNEKWGTNLTVDDYDEHWGAIWKVDSLEVERRAQEYHNSSTMRRYGHIGGAKEVLARLSERHHLLIATSSRMQMRADTVEWLNEHFDGLFLDEDIHFAGIWDNIDDSSITRTKRDIIESFGIDVLIDDQLKHCLAAAAAGANSILFGEYSWNKIDDPPRGVVRCNSWAEVEREISRLESKA